MVLSNLHLGDIPGWLVALATLAAAAGTVGALWAALGQIRTERETRQQAERDTIERDERWQAERVSAWYGGHDPATEDGAGEDWLVLLNRSHEPVYQAVASLVFVEGGSGPRDGEDYLNMRGDENPYEYLADQPTLGVIPPGQWRVRVPGGWAGMMRQPGAEVAFKDRSGRSWVRRATGALERLPSEPFDHYQLPRPLLLRTPEPDPSA